MQFNLYPALKWWRQSGKNNHLGGSFNLHLYLAICEIKANHNK